MASNVTILCSDMCRTCKGHARFISVYVRGLSVPCRDMLGTCKTNIWDIHGNISGRNGHVYRRLVTSYGNVMNFLMY